VIGKDGQLRSRINTARSTEQLSDIVRIEAQHAIDLGIVGAMVVEH
jgi:hypothetical protein